MSKQLPIAMDRLADRFKALSNKHRLAIYLRLAECCPPNSSCAADGEGAPCVGMLGDTLDLAPSTISHHLKELTRAGLIRMDRRGQMVYCSVDEEGLRDMTAFFRVMSAA